MDIYLVRHTTPNIAKGICYGQSDIALADSYPEEFKIILDTIPKGAYHIISSPLQRCSAFAKWYAELVEVAYTSPITYDDRLLELNFGDWELMPWNDIPQKDITPWMNDFVNVRVPNGESYIDLTTRVYSFFEELIQSAQTKPIIIVTHAGPIRSLLAKFLEVPLEKSFGIKIAYGDVIHLKKEDNAIKVITEIPVL
ncbi:alpha-ribazole phosphatase [uncultured Dokdonia sp.]|uniref:alpha-ribazole phosphatase n=1 Tax=uncultured Dokdonia sp. TaxID=575653 RepID=UPI002637A312|nr:alpha-ribazole phosphatase [uncultured Dokdonia sp.]